MEASALSAPAGLHRATVASRLLVLRSDEQLLSLFRAGNEDAFGVIHDRYRQRLFAYSRQMLGGSRSDAEDVLQDVFLSAYRALRADDRPVSLRAWLYRVAHNRCVDQIRRPVPAAADIFQLSMSPLHDPLAEAEQRDELRRLVKDVQRLPEQQRSALLMREIDGMSYAELATALDTTVPAIKSLLVRARIGLVEAIDARDADCADIRHDLAASYDRGVRASGRARRHLRDCNACSTYRAQMREVREGFAALSPGPAPAGLIAKLLGIGGASSGAAAGSSGAVVGGGAAAVSATKVAAVVCCAAAITGGAAVEVKQIALPLPLPQSHAQRHRAPSLTATPAPGPRVVTRSPVGMLLGPVGRPQAVHGVRLFGRSGLAPRTAPVDQATDGGAVLAGDTGGLAGPEEDQTPSTGAANPATASGDPIPVGTLLGTPSTTTPPPGTAPSTPPGSGSPDSGSTATASSTSQSGPASSSSGGQSTQSGTSGSSMDSGSSTSGSGSAGSPPPSGSTSHG